MIDLPKEFVCLSHELLLAKPHACGSSIAALRLIHSYLTKRKERTKVNLSYSSWEEILFGVPQGSIHDDNTPYRTANTIDEVNTRSQSLERDSMMLFQWFSEVV